MNTWKWIRFSRYHSVKMFLVISHSDHISHEGSAASSYWTNLPFSFVVNHICFNGSFRRTLLLSTTITCKILIGYIDFILQTNITNFILVSWKLDCQLFRQITNFQWKTKFEQNVIGTEVNGCRRLWQVKQTKNTFAAVIFFLFFFFSNWEMSILI